MTENLYLIQCPNSLWSPGMKHEYREQFRKKHYSSCRHIITIKLTFDLHMREMGTDSPFNFDRSTLFPIIRRDLMDVLHLRPGKRFVFGRIFTPEGKLLTDRKAVYPLQRVQLRGKEAMAPSFCKVCGKFLYQPHDPVYVLKRDFPRYQVSFSSPYYSMLIANEDILDRIRTAGIKQLTIKELPIRDQPLDNLPADLSTLTPEILKSLQRKGLVPKNRLVKKSARL